MSRRLGGLPLHPAFLNGLLTRSVIIWFGVRGLLLVAGLLLPTLPGAVQLVPTLPGAGAVVALTALLTALDGRRHSETVLLANLGVPESRLVLIAMIPPGALETMIQVLA